MVVTWELPRDRQRAVSQLPAVIGTVAVVAAVVAGAVFAAQAPQRKAPTHHAVSPFPKLQGILPAAPLPVSAMSTSGALVATAAPELVAAGALWSVQTAGESDSFVIRSDPTTLRTLSTTRFTQSTVHCVGLCQLLRAGSVVVMPDVGWRPLAPNGQPIGAPGLQAAILRFDVGTGRMLTPLLVDDTKIDVATPHGVYVQVGLNTLGLLDSTGSRIMQRISMPFDDAVVYASGLLWGFDVDGRRLVGVDPTSGQIGRSFPMPLVAEAQLLPGGSDALLVLPKKEGPGGALAVYRFDTQSMRLTSGTAYVGGTKVPAGWAVEGSHLWTAYDSRVLEYDAVTFRMIHAYSVTGALNDTGINATVPVTGDRMFISDSNSNRLGALDLAKLR